MADSSLRHFSFSKLSENYYNVDYTMLDIGQAPFQALIGQISPGQSSEIHNHFEAEVFLFLSGTGEIHIDGKILAIKQGDGIRIPPFKNHVIVNSNVSEPLRFISMYWNDDIKSLPNSPALDSPVTIIYSPPATPNGDLHLGHLSGPYLAADIYHRYLQQSGLIAKHVTGRDDHQTYIATKAKAVNVNPEIIADHFATKIRETLALCDIEIDYYIQPNQNGDYAAFITNTFKSLYAAGFIVSKNEMATYSSNGQYLHEAYIRGNCPHCLCESDGNACEECGRPNACVDLINPYEKNSKNPIHLRPCKRLYFCLSRFSEQLQNYIKSTPMSAHAFALSQTMLTAGLPDICISHPGDWGIPTPIKEFEHQRIYVWFELAIAYLWGTNQLLQNPSMSIKKENIEWVNFYGFDNTYYHTLLFPAVYFALGMKPASAHVVNELLDLDGSKFSTSRDHLILARDLAERIPVDYLRWTLCEIRPEGSRANFTLSHLTSSINDTFIAILNAWITKLQLIMKQSFSNVIPEPGAWTDEHRQFLQCILQCQREILNHYNIATFSPRGLVTKLRNLAKAGLTFITAHQCFVNANDMHHYLRTSVALSMLALKTYALLLRPIMPTLGDQLLSSIGISCDINLTDIEFVKSGTACDFIHLPDLQHLNQILANINPTPAAA